MYQLSRFGIVVAGPLTGKTAFVAARRGWPLATVLDADDAWQHLDPILQNQLTATRERGDWAQHNAMWHALLHHYIAACLGALSPSAPPTILLVHSWDDAMAVAPPQLLLSYVAPPAFVFHRRVERCSDPLRARLALECREHTLAHDLATTRPRFDSVGAAVLFALATRVETAKQAKRPDEPDAPVDVFGLRHHRDCYCYFCGL